MPSEPVKNDDNDVVEMSDPTVNCDVVARRVSPAAFETMIEEAGNDVAFVPPRATVTVGSVTAFVNSEYDRPVEKVVVAELNLEKSAAAIHPATDAVAVVQPRTAPEVPRTTGELETVIGPPPPRVVVATVPSSAAFVVSPTLVQYARPATVGMAEVPTCPLIVPDVVIVPPRRDAPAVILVTVPAFCVRQFTPIA
jgi:hypothetical protein